VNVSGATRPNLARDGDWGTESLTPTVDLGTNPHAIVWRFTPNGSGGYSLTVDVDGTHYPSTTSSQTGPVSFTHLLIGARSDLPTWQFVGDISEIVVVPAYVSDADVGSYYAYAQTTWGVP
jgi:hypothetical protein